MHLLRTSSANRGSGRRRHRANAAVLVATILAVATLGPTVGRGVAARFHHGAGQAVRPRPSVPAAQTPTATSSPPASTPTVVAAAVAKPATSAGALPEVERLQTVPPVRDFIVEIDGIEIASDAAGLIEVPPAHRHGTIRVVGRNANPPVQRIEFTTWPDGSADPTRPLDTVGGPSVSIGLIVSSRVMATISSNETPKASIRFDSLAGPFDVVVDEPVWLPALQSVARTTGMTTEPIIYTASEITIDGVTTELPVQRFFPTPEAKWSIHLGGSVGAPSNLG